jgi:ABC-type glutathione transport system ATPase component
MANLIIPRYADLGKASAEDDDEYFDDCFVDTGLIERLLSRDSSVSVIVGRTGSGKSALVRRIRETHENVLEINPENLSLGYLSDSWLLRVLTEEEFDLGLFYQQLWRHVIVVELLRYYEQLDSKSKSETFLNQIYQLFSDNAGKKEALQYLEQYGGQFWSDTDERIKRIADDFERQVEQEYGAKYKILSAKYKRGDKFARHESKELVSTAKKKS